MQVYYRIAQLNNNFENTLDNKPEVLSLSNQKQISASLDLNKKQMSLETIAKENPLLQTKQEGVGDILRKCIEKPRSYEAIEKLNFQKREADRSQKILINTKIRDIKQSLNQKKSPVNFFIRHYNDLKGNNIGISFCSNKDIRGTCINIGDSEYINDLGLAFVEGRSRFGFPYLRSSIYLNDNGKEVLRRYIKKYLRNKFSRKKAGELSTHKKTPISNQRIRDMLDMKQGYDIMIGGYEVHINLQGKIEIFSSKDYFNNVLVDDSLLNKVEARRLWSYTDRNNYKKWIFQTTPEINEFIGESFKALSEIYKEIFI